MGKNKIVTESFDKDNEKTKNNRRRTIVIDPVTGGILLEGGAKKLVDGSLTTKNSIKQEKIKNEGSVSKSNQRHSVFNELG